ncbi:HAMP domain-containing histidine kinase [Paenibacillus glycanilyticus]|uniref:sensor histidine kinase n=1 Tax=Paenibacillus glycanilyticus TaxID=126569 RepID=UPI00203BC594|nr:HAMP domain-containing sensor histidine kinase [Paenibacillus glycanilyticus]MCM3631267.1 HAMP domain-containing histidine kinase [Paenibacillus glycanilyticus]
MSIRKKLILSYTAMVAVPVILFGLTIAALGNLLIKDAMPGAGSGGEASGHSLPFASIRELFMGRTELTSGLRFIAEHDPKLLSDPDFLSSTEAELRRVEAGIILIHNNRMTYASPGLPTDAILAEVQGQSKREEAEHPGPPSGDEWEAIPYTSPDGSTGELVIVTDMEPVAGFFKRLLPLVLLTLLAALAVTSGVLTYLVSRSIIKPLYALKEAADHIREGDLDHAIRLRRQDEIGQLGAAFEEMRVRLQASLGAQLELEQGRKELLAHISHDLKTPITAIQGCTDCLRDGIADTEEKRQKYIQMIAGKTTEMNRMIEELQLYSTLDTGKLPFRWETVNLTAYMIQLVNELQLDPRFGGTEVTFKGGSNRAAALIRADRQKLHRALMNLADNSLQHMKLEPKKLEFLLEEEPDGRYLLQIRDNGEGVPAEALPRVFDRFFRAESSRSPGKGNSGLGLAIVKQIMEAHDGTAAAASSPGEGTTIQLRFPAVKQDMPEPEDGGLG